MDPFSWYYIMQNYNQYFYAYQISYQNNTLKWNKAGDGLGFVSFAYLIQCG